MHTHEYRVHESRKRSLLKALTGYLFEVGIDTLIIGMILGIMGLSTEVAFTGGFGISLLTELFCFLSRYGSERLWNRLDYGRHVTKREKRQDGSR
jgi:hypothetical protein